MHRMLVVLGLIVALAAVGAQYYAETVIEPGLFGDTTKTTRPYQPYAFPLFVGACVLLAVGVSVRESA